MKTLDVICPGFASDCLETLEEIAMQNQEFFHQHGGEQLRYIPALNARDDHVLALQRLLLKHLAGWPEAERGADPSLAAESRKRALAMGAER